jgi:hypothetical protein
MEGIKTMLSAITVHMSLALHLLQAAESGELGEMIKFVLGFVLLPLVLGILANTLTGGFGTGIILAIPGLTRVGIAGIRFGNRLRRKRSENLNIARDRLEDRKNQLEQLRNQSEMLKVLQKYASFAHSALRYLALGGLSLFLSRMLAFMADALYPEGEWRQYGELAGILAAICSGVYFIKAFEYMLYATPEWKPYQDIDDAISECDMHIKELGDDVADSSPAR